MKKNQYNHTAILLLFVLVLSVVHTSSEISGSVIEIVNESGTTVKSFSCDFDITDSLDCALQYTQKNASKEHPLLLKLSGGSYKVTSTLQVSSYTTLDLNGATIRNMCSTTGNILISPNDTGYSGYESLTDFKLMNGTLNGGYNRNRSCILRFAHAQNIEIENVRFLNNYCSHHIEFAAVNHLTIRGCTFENQFSALNVSTSESIQIDILDKYHFHSFENYDDTMNRQILIENCTFKNLLCGVGTHNYFNNKYQTGITIRNSRFENIKYSAISAVNFTDTEFYNNKFVNCGSDIFYCTWGNGT